jgi:hypothetical protein
VLYIIPKNVTIWDKNHDVNANPEHKFFQRRCHYIQRAWKLTLQTHLSFITTINNSTLELGNYELFQDPFIIDKVKENITSTMLCCIISHSRDTLGGSGHS